jgi:pimeloyl-ACP methyl ester carboxylesterase
MSSVPSQTFSLKQMIANVFILLASCLCIIYMGLAVYAAIRADTLIFPAPPSSYQDDASIIKLESSDGERISAYYLQAEKSDRLLIYSHGNGEDIGSARPFLELFQRAGISVLAYDYPGYGTSTGTPSERGSYAAIEATYQYATEKLGYTDARITLYGRSLGSGPSAWLAEQKPVAGVIFDGAFASTFRVMTNIRLLPWDKFDNYARLPNIKSPVLVIHGTEDQTVPFSHAIKNWEVIQSPKHKLFVQGARHGDVIERAGHEYWDTVIAFIKGDLQYK